MFLFDPSTGKHFTEPRNDMDKTTVDACKGAIELLKGEDGTLDKVREAISTQPSNIPTNGDVFMATFPDAIKSNYIESGYDMADYVEIYLGDYVMRVSVDWWYSEYEI